MTTVAVIQARMSSSRLPGKVLAELAGLPTIIFMIERVRRARTVDAVVVATSSDPSDDPLCDVLRSHGVDHVRGSLDDVLDRFRIAAEASSADIVIRLTGDCPLIDPDLIDSVVGLVEADCHYASNTDPPSFPDGLDVEAFTRAALDAACQRAGLASEREHVTPWMRRDDVGMVRRSLLSPIDLSALRWTIDYPDDLVMVRHMIAGLEKPAREADRFDFLRVVATGEGFAEQRHARNEGYAKSLADEARGPAGASDDVRYR